MTTHPSDELKHVDYKAPIFKGLIRGMLPLYLLFILNQRGALHGVKMIRFLGEMSDGRWKPSPGSIYPVLRRLEKEGLVSGRWKRGQAAPQRVYRLTAKGKTELPKHKEKLLIQLLQARELIDEHLRALEADQDDGEATW